MIRRLAALSLRQKIVAIIILTTATVTVAVIPAIFFTLQGSLHAQRQRHLAGVKQLVERLVEDNRRTVRNYAVLFSTYPQVKDNLYYYAELAGERIHPLNAVRHLAGSFALGFVELGDRYGRIVASSAQPELHDLDRSGEILLRAALADKVVTGIERHESGFLLKAVAPIHHDESQLIGTISIGVVMDDSFARMIQELSSVEIAIVGDGGTVMASTIAALPKKTKVDLRQGELRAGGRNFELMELPFDESSGAPLGAIVVMSADTLAPLLRRSYLAVLAVLFLLSAAAVAFTLLAMRRVFAPLRHFRDGAEKIGGGDFGHRIEVTSRDEIGGLAEVFNAMAANLQKMREVEEKLRHSERLASIGEFTAATAHELNNPIANIIGLLKLARKDLPAGSEAAEDVDTVLEEAHRCGSIVRDLLVYSRSSRPHREPVDMDRLVEETVRAVKGGHLDGKEIDIVYDGSAGGIQPLPVDPVQVSQVLRNLLVNSVQAIASRGTIHVSLREEAGIVTVAVSDDGCGIRKEHLAKVFYPFFTTKKSGEGTGLGLAVCYTIVQSHGGEITAESVEGEGAVFTVTLPREKEDVPDDQNSGYRG